MKTLGASKSNDRPFKQAILLLLVAACVLATIYPFFQKVRHEKAVAKLATAIVLDNEPAVKEALSMGAKPNKDRVFGEYPLIFAVKSCSVSSFIELMAQGANIHLPSRDGKSEFEMALQSNGDSSGNVKMLIELSKYAENTSQLLALNSTAMYAAIEGQHSDFIKQLISRPLQLNNRISDQRGSVFMLACRSANDQVVNALIEKGADVNQSKKMALHRYMLPPTH